MGLICLAAALAAAGAAPAAAVEVVVDDFGDAQGPISAPPTATSFQDEIAGEMVPPGAANGERDLRLSLLEAAGTLDSTAEVVAGSLNFSVPEVRSELLVSWDGNDDDDALDETGLGGVDLTDGGTNNTLRLTVGSVSGVAELVVELYTDAANSSRAFATVTAAGDVFFPFGAFAARLGSGADPANVGAITLEIRATAVAALGVSDFRAVGPSVEAIKVDALLVDSDADGEADPGETLRYQIDVSSTGGTATGVEVDDTVGANLNFIPGSTLVSPIAVNDAYTTVGNVQLAVTDPLAGLLANDFDPDDGTSSFTVTAFDAASLQGGAVTVAADGTFTYDAPLGLNGVDSFTYTLTDLDGLTDGGSVSLLVEGTIWFVDDGPGGCGAQPCGSGTQADPFGGFHPTQLNGAGGGGDLDGEGDIIFVFEGSGDTDSGDAAGFELEDGQTLHGEGVELVIGGITIVPAGINPILTNTAGTPGHGVSLARDNTIRGLTVGGTDAGGSAFTASADVGALAIEDSDVSGAGGIFDVANGGTLDVTFDSVASTSSSGAAGIRISGVDGSFTVSNPALGVDTSIAGADAGISIQSSGGASFSFGETSIVTNASGGSGIDLGGGGPNPAATFTFDDLSVTTGAGTGLLAAGGGTLNIGGGASAISATGGAAVSLSSMTLDDGGGGGVTFASLASTGSAGDGVLVTTVTGDFTVTGTTTVDNPAGDGLDLDNSPGLFTFANLDVDDPGSAGVRAGAMSGLVTFSGSSKTITDTPSSGGDGGFGVDLFASNVDFTNGGLDIDTTTGIGFQADGPGTINVTGSGNTVTAGAATGVDLQSVALGANGVTFQSVSVDGGTVGIDIDGGGSGGFFTVTGVGTGDGTGGTIQNTSQNGVLVQNTDNISLSNMTFISAAADGGGSCTELVFTGCNAAIELDTVVGADIVNASITGAEDHGIFGQTVTDLDITGTDITGLGADVDSDEHGVFVVDLLGTVAGGTESVFDGLTIDDAQDTAILVRNSTATNPGDSANPDQLTVSNSQLTDAGDSGLSVKTLAAAANLGLAATGNTITNTVDGIDVEAQAGDAQASVGGAGGLANTISDGGGDMVNGVRFFASAAIDDATVTGTATNNTITLFALGSPAPVSGLNGISANASGASSGNLGTVRATVNDNVINSSFSGIETQTVHGVITTNEGSGTTAQNVISIDNNVITLDPPTGTMLAETVGVGVDGGITGAGTTVRVTNNTIVAEGDAANGASVGIQILPTELLDPAGTNTRVCTRVTGNEVSTPNNPFAGAFGTTELDVIAAPVVSGSFLDVEAIPVGVRTPAQLKSDLEPLNTNTEVGDTTGFIFGVITGVATCPN